ncbi:hypothetical protein Rhe02_92820 [Rhizocola hellebori]|uniref:SDR family oxidoreductase n=1 Tax=Rhizocola hellebori TaxID=1392758 RepID=A0A8J3VLU8_9ACTN|nr:SDR family oxidoreductase [Rhizocola hellebori]GIH11215.1 hypothetical protein Rhe02_92820 [Rhizocola hellebori]
MTLRIVVGAGGLVGTAIARHAANTDGDAVAVDLALATAPLSAEHLQLDATSEDFAQWLASAIADRSRVELYYAAGQVAPLCRVTDTPPAAFEKAMHDLVVAYTVTSRFAETTRQAGIAASIVIIGSIGAHQAHRYMIGYDASRAGLESVARGLALEYGQHGVTTRVLAVGPIAESATTQADGELLPALARLVPTQRYAPIDQIAAAAIAYGGPAFDYANGHTLRLDGGLTIQLRPSDIERRPER